MTSKLLAHTTLLECLSSFPTPPQLCFLIHRAQLLHHRLKIDNDHSPRFGNFFNISLACSYHMNVWMRNPLLQLNSLNLTFGPLMDLPTQQLGACTTFINYKVPPAHSSKNLSPSQAALLYTQLITVSSSLPLLCQNRYAFNSYLVTIKKRILLPD